MDSNLQDSSVVPFELEIANSAQDQEVDTAAALVARRDPTDTLLPPKTAGHGILNVLHSISFMDRYYFWSIICIQILSQCLMLVYQ